MEKPWTTLLAIVGKGKVPKADDQPESDPEVAARIALQRNVDTGLVMGVRADDVSGVRHSATWSRHRRAEGNKGGDIRVMEPMDVRSVLQPDGDK